MNQPTQGAPDHERIKAIWNFRKLIERASLHFDREASLQINQFTSYYHALCAGDLANVIMDEFIKAAQNQQANQISYLYIMDSVLKHVQGNYIAAFQQNLNFIMHLVFQNQSSPDFKQKLKVFKCWQVLGLFQGLDDISRDLGLYRFVSDSLTLKEQEMANDENAAKIQDFGLNFYPLSIPYDVVMNPNVRIIRGSQFAEKDVRIHFLQQFQVPQPYWQHALSQDDLHFGATPLRNFQQPPLTHIAAHQGPARQPAMPAMPVRQYQPGQPGPAGQGQGEQEQVSPLQKERPQFIQPQNPAPLHPYASQSVAQSSLIFAELTKRRPGPKQGPAAGPTATAPFLPSLFKSFHSFNQQLCLSIGNFVSQKTQTLSRPPTFSDFESLCQSNAIAQAQLFESLKFQCKICGMRLNHGHKFRQHLDQHFNQHLNLSENSRRAQYLTAQDFQKSKKSVQNTDIQVIPYTKDKSILCVVCSQRIEMQQTDAEIVLKEAQNVTIDDTVQTIHTACFAMMSQQPQQVIEEEPQLLGKRPVDVERLKDMVRQLEQSKKRQRV